MHQNSFDCEIIYQPPFICSFQICSRCCVIQIQIHLQTLKQQDCSVRTNVNTTGKFVKLWSRVGRQTNLLVNIWRLHIGRSQPISLTCQILSPGDYLCFDEMSVLLMLLVTFTSWINIVMNVLHAYFQGLWTLFKCT